MKRVSEACEPKAKTQQVKKYLREYLLAEERPDHVPMDQYGNEFLEKRGRLEAATPQRHGRCREVAA